MKGKAQKILTRASAAVAIVDLLSTVWYFVRGRRLLALSGIFLTLGNSLYAAHWLQQESEEKRNQSPEREVWGVGSRASIPAEEETTEQPTAES